MVTSNEGLKKVSRCKWTLVPGLHPMTRCYLGRKKEASLQTVSICLAEVGFFVLIPTSPIILISFKHILVVNKKNGFNVDYSEAGCKGNFYSEI